MRMVGPLLRGGGRIDPQATRSEKGSSTSLDEGGAATWTEIAGRGRLWPGRCSSGLLLGANFGLPGAGWGGYWAGIPWSSAPSFPG